MLISYTALPEIKEEISKIKETFSLLEDTGDSLRQAEFLLVSDNATDLSGVNVPTLIYLFLYRLMEPKPLFKLCKAIREAYTFSNSLSRFFEAEDVEYTKFLQLVTALYLHQDWAKDFFSSLFCYLGLDGEKLSDFSFTLAEFYCEIFYVLAKNKSTTAYSGNLKKYAERLNYYYDESLSKYDKKYWMSFCDSNLFKKNLKRLLIVSL